MIKMNRKGFTLVELLAVIIILAIVVGITIPAVLTTTNKTKEKAFKTLAESTAQWFDRQYEIYRTDVSALEAIKVDETFLETCLNDENYCLVEKSESGETMEDLAYSGPEFTPGDKIFDVLGFNDNINDLFVAINEANGKSCVVLYANPDGDYYTTNDKRIMTGGNCL